MSHVVSNADILKWLPRRAQDANKWTSAVCVVAGGPGMFGAAMLASESAMRSGAGMVRLCVPGADPHTFPPSEVVGVFLDELDWAGRVAEESQRCKSLVIGPGLGRTKETIGNIREVLLSVDLPTVIDADGLFALEDVETAKQIFKKRKSEVVLTPHDGEFERLAGTPVGDDRLSDCVGLAKKLGATVLLKGPTSYVASPKGKTYLIDNGDERLATAGTGDVLSGIIGAFLAEGLDAPRAAAAAAHVHGGAARLAPLFGMVARDLLDLIPEWLNKQLPNDTE